MYRECRYIHASGGRCDLPALKDSNWCYFHSQVQQRSTFRHNRRGADGRFAARPAPHENTEQPEAGSETVDYGTYPANDLRVPHPERSEGWDKTNPAAQNLPENSVLDLPPLEDPVSIQLALIDVAQALAANRIDTKRAGLLLYALQVASANTRHMRFSSFNAVRSVTYDEAGLPLAPQQHGKDVADRNEEIRRGKESAAAPKSEVSFVELLLSGKR
ncbi:MAG: hypothetical protein WBQ79_01055 [Acidobacteriaceae bacterium]